MNPSDLTPSTLYLVFSWIIAALVGFPAVLQFTWMLFAKRQRVNRVLTVWVGLCFLVFSPFRYLCFLFVLAAVFFFHSLWLFSFGWGVTLAPPAFAILCFVGVIWPLLLVDWISGVESPNRTSRNTVAAAMLAPFIAFVGHVVFLLLLPLAGWTATGFDAVDLIRATNGPAYYVFRIVPRGEIALPPNLQESATIRDCLRAHIAFNYMSKGDCEAYMKAANRPADAEVTSTN